MNVNSVFAMILSASSTLAFADIYRCIDNNGKVQYGAKQPAGMDCKKLDLSKLPKSETRMPPSLTQLDVKSANEVIDYAQTASLLAPLAEQGDVRAQAALGVLYEDGLGVTQNFKEAVKWYRLAGEQGHSFAQGLLGEKYHNGRGVVQDYKEAVKWYRLAAEQGLDVAQLNLAGMYKEGNGVVQDYKEAVKWYRLAAEQGNAIGQSKLGEMYFMGHGVPQHFKEAEKWFRLAAEQGDDTGQVILGMLYYDGLAGSQDKIRGHMWTNLGVTNAQTKEGEKIAREARDKIASHMTV